MGRGLDASTNLGKVLLVSSGFGIVLALIGIIGELETDFLFAPLINCPPIILSKDTRGFILKTYLFFFFYLCSFPFY